MHRLTFDTSGLCSVQPTGAKPPELSVNMSIPTLSTGASTSRPMDRSAKTIFDERFVPTSDQYKPFDESEEAIMSARPIYEQFAFFLIYI